MDRKEAVILAYMNGERLIVFQQLRLDADNAIESFHRNSAYSQEYATGVRCAGVRDDAKDGSEPRMRVIIEGSDPGDGKLGLHITVQLRRLGWRNVEIEFI